MNPITTYYIYLDDKVQGPYSKDELKARLNAGVLQGDNQICPDGHSEWTPLSDILPDILPAPSSPVTPPIDDSRAPEQRYEGIDRRGFILSIVGIFLFGLVLSGVPDVALYLPLITVGLAIIPAALRFKNIGRHPAWAFLLLVPLLGLFVTVPCFILPPGFSHHKQFDLASKVISAIFGFVIFLLVIILISV